MARRSRNNRGNKSRVAADKSEPEASSSNSASKRQKKKSINEPQIGSGRETRSSNATKAKVNETDKDKVTAKSNANDKKRTGRGVMEPPTKKSKNSRALGSASASASSSTGSRTYSKASTSKTSSSSKSPDKKTEISNNTSQLHQDLFPFPTEIYEMIFKELKGLHLQDLHNVSNATREWRKLLKKDRVLFLFPKVFEILVREDFTDFLPTKNEDREDEKNFYVYDLRLVCKSWNESIQNYIQLHPSNLQLEPFVDTDNRMAMFVNDDWESGFPHIKDTYRFESVEKITEFMDNHHSTHSSEDNPFFSRLLDIQQGERVNETDQTEFWNTVVNLLLTYGKHLYYFGVTFDDPMTPVKCIQLLHRVLSLVPNIKSLHIAYNQENQSRTSEREKRQIVREIATGEIQLPNLANLQVLEMSNLPDIISQHLLQTNDHVKAMKIEISRDFPIKFSTMFQQAAMIRELKTLHINLQTREDIVDLQTTLGATPAWPLNSLFIFFSLKEDRYDTAPFFPVRQWPQWSNIFRLIEDKFGETLVNLTIQLPKTELDEDKQFLRDTTASTLRLNLPRLKQLNVKIPNVTSVDFLLGVKDTLEDATIKVTYTDKLSAVERRREKIKFNGIFEKMENSNIWDLLPQLKKLVVEVDRPNRYLYRGCFCCGPPEFDTYSYARTKENGITKVDGD